MVDRHGPRAFFLTSLKGEAVRRGQSPHEDHAHRAAMYKRALIFAKVALLRSSCYSELTRRTAMARTPVEERLEKMREDERKLRARRKALDARLSAARRKAETRERIMLGAIILHHIDRKSTRLNSSH